MKLPRVRFTVRRMMILVAIAAISLALPVELGRRRGRFLELVAHHAAAERSISDEMHLMAPVLDLSSLSGRRDGWQSIRGRLEHHRTMRVKYQNAIASPWLPVSPDPPEPK